MFKGNDALSLMGDFLFSERFRGYRAYAHNGSSYDTLFLLRYLNSQRLASDVNYKGGKVLQVTSVQHDLVLCDLMLHIQMSLSQLPKALGFNDWNTKGSIL